MAHSKGTCSAKNKDGHGETVVWSKPNHGDPTKKKRTAKQIWNVCDGEQLIIEDSDGEFYQVSPFKNGFENSYDVNNPDCGWVKKHHCQNIIFSGKEEKEAAKRVKKEASPEVERRTPVVVETRAEYDRNQKTGGSWHLPPPPPPPADDGTADKERKEKKKKKKKRKRSSSVLDSTYEMGQHKKNSSAMNATH